MATPPDVPYFMETPHFPPGSLGNISQPRYVHFTQNSADGAMTVRRDGAVFQTLTPDGLPIHPPRFLRKTADWRNFMNNGNREFFANVNGIFAFPPEYASVPDWPEVADPAPGNAPPAQYPLDAVPFHLEGMVPFGIATNLTDSNPDSPFKPSTMFYQDEYQGRMIVRRDGAVFLISDPDGNYIDPPRFIRKTVADQAKFNPSFTGPDPAFKQYPPEYIATPFTDGSAQ
ncbi:hypothetical protein [Burkholderia sp. Cy-637]|uniref:hypothetical protein n=1 Tax=Burkholderia sp. Cy-637 TaxID=2608327 RepID=UPI00141E4C68|nr:hypothetical protein [Burkholderia sp. Cy-637]NIF88866.1 hypothetical protein [Burkholderia sp. Cy-637]